MTTNGNSNVELRYYQNDAVVAVFDYWNDNDGNPLVVLPTGSGKSIVLGEFCHRACTLYPDTRILVLSHVKELLVQDTAAILSVWPDANVTIYSAGLGSKDLTGQVIVGGIQSIYKRAERVGFVDVVLIDEAHLLTPDDAGMYRRFLRELTAINPHLKVCGFTATDYRLDRGLLWGQPDSLFTGVCYEMPLTKLVDEGYLVPLVGKATRQKISVEGVGKRGGEFIAEQLAANCDQPELIAAIVDETIQRAAVDGRGSWLTFCVTVEHAKHMAEAFTARGIVTAVVTADTPATERAEIFAAYKRGEIQNLCGVGIFTTGFDAPGVDLIVLGRPTESKGLLVQMTGRGTRLAEGKEDCQILDFAGNILRHGPIDLIRGEIKEKGEKGGMAPVKVCPDCDSYCYTAVRVCPHCGHQFPPPQHTLRFKAVDAPAMSRELTNQWLDVTKVEYRRHTKIGSPDSMLVTYHCGLVTYREWICFEHSGWAREKAVRWWSRRAPGELAPRTVDEGIYRVASLPEPNAIMVRPAGKYFDIINHRF